MALLDVNSQEYNLIKIKMESNGKDIREYDVFRTGEGNYAVSRKKTLSPIRLTYKNSDKYTRPRERTPSRYSEELSEDYFSEEEEEEEAFSRSMERPIRTKKKNITQERYPKRTSRSNTAQSRPQRTKAQERADRSHSRRKEKEFVEEDKRGKRGIPRDPRKKIPRSKRIYSEEEIFDDQEDTEEEEGYVEHEPEKKKMTNPYKKRNTKEITKKKHPVEFGKRKTTKNSYHKKERNNSKNKGKKEPKRKVDKTIIVTDPHEEKDIDEKMAYLGTAMTGVPSRATEKGTGHAVHGERIVSSKYPPKVTSWNIMDIKDVIDLNFSKKEEEASKKEQSSSESKSKNKDKVKKPVKIRHASKSDDVRSLLEEKEEPKPIIPILKKFEESHPETSSKKKLRQRRKVEDISVGGPNYSRVSDLKPFAYTTIYRTKTRYQKLVDTSTIIPYKNKGKLKKVYEAINSLDAIVEEFNQPYKYKDINGNVEERQPEGCLRKIICMHNISKTHNLEPPSGFGMIMDSTKNVPIKTTPFNPKKFYYGTLAFRIPTDVEIDTREAIEKFKIPIELENGERDSISLLEYIESNSGSALSSYLIPSETTKFLESNGEEVPEFLVEETPKMDANLIGRGTYAGLYISSTREQNWKKHVWVVVQCNDPHVSQQLYDHIRDVQDDSMGININDKNLFWKSQSNKKEEGTSEDDDEEEKEEEEEEEEEGGENNGSEQKAEGSDNEKKDSPEESKSPDVLGNWASCIFNNSKVESAQNHMSSTRYDVALEILSIYGIDVSREDIKSQCHPVVETVTNTFYHDKISSNYIFAGSGVTILFPETKHVIVGECPSKGPVILHGPRKSEESKTSIRDNTLSWNTSEAKGFYRLFPCSTGRIFTNSEIRSHLKVQKYQNITEVPICDHIVYTGKYSKEIDYYPHIDEKGSLLNTRYIDPTKGDHYHARLTNISYVKRTTEHKRREEKCGFNRECPITHLQPVAIRIGKEQKKQSLFDF